MAVLYVDRGGSSIQTLPAFDDPAVAATALGALRAVPTEGRTRELVIRKIDGIPVAESAVRSTLLEAGFSAGYRGLVLRP